MLLKGLAAKSRMREEGGVRSRVVIKSTCAEERPSGSKNVPVILPRELMKRIISYMPVPPSQSTPGLRSELPLLSKPEQPEAPPRWRSEPYSLGRLGRIMCWRRNVLLGGALLLASWQGAVAQPLIKI